MRDPLNPLKRQFGRPVFLFSFMRCLLSPKIVAFAIISTVLVVGDGVAMLCFVTLTPLSAFASDAAIDFVHPRQNGKL
jgi:hypothetical protein